VSGAATGLLSGVNQVIHNLKVMLYWH